MVNNNERNTQETDSSLMKQLAQKFYSIMDEFVIKTIDFFIKDNDFYRFVVGEVTRKQKNGTFMVDIGDTTISNVINKSNCILEVGDTVTILDRFGSNFRNCFIVCRNGVEESLEERLLNRIQQLESDIDKLKSDVAALKGGTSK